MTNERGCRCPVHDHGVNWGHSRECDAAWYATRSKPLSAEEYSEVERFGLDEPLGLETDAEGMLWGLKFVAWSFVVVVGSAALVAGLIWVVVAVARVVFR